MLIFSLFLKIQKQKISFSAFIMCSRTHWRPLRSENISCPEKWRLSSLSCVSTHNFSYECHYHMIQAQGNKSFRKQIIKFWFVGSIFIVFFYNSKKAFPEMSIWKSKCGLFWEVVDVVRRCTKWKYDKKWTHMNPKDTLDAIRKFRWISSIDHEFWLSTIITYSTFKKFQIYYVLHPSDYVLHIFIHYVLHT